MIYLLTICKDKANRPKSSFCNLQTIHVSMKAYSNVTQRHLSKKKKNCYTETVNK